MTDDVNRPVTPDSPSFAEHAHHARLLVTRYFDNDDELTREERLLASALVRTCPMCAELGPEIDAIKLATRTSTVPSARRDFRITAADARRAGSRDIGGLGARIAATLRTEFVRPVAGAAVAVGLVLAIVGAVPYLNGGGSPSTVQQTPEGSVFAATGPGAELATPSADQNGKASTPPPEGANVAAETAGIDTSGQKPPHPAPTTPRRSAADSTPEATIVPQVAVVGGSPSPLPAGNQAAGGALTNPVPAADSSGNPEPLPPLLIFGVLLAIVGLLIVLLTVLARRMEPNGR